MKTGLHYTHAHTRLLIATIIGVVVAVAAPDVSGWVARALLGWNAAVWLYLGSVGWLMFRISPERLKKSAEAQAENAFAVLAIATLAAVASFGAVIYDASAAKSAGVHQAASDLAYVMATVTGSWLLVPTLFALNYASRFHEEPGGEGLEFPGAADDYLPDYRDFLYFSFTIAVACQTSDVAVSTRPMRRLVLLQSLISFAFNTMVLAFTVNTAASLLGT